MLETVAQMVSGASIVEIMSAGSDAVSGVDSMMWATPGSERPLAHIRKRVLGQLTTKASLRSIVCSVAGIGWGVLIEPIQADEGEPLGALVVCRPGRAWSREERSLTEAFGALLSHAATLAAHEQALLDQVTLDELVGQVAEHLMSASMRTRQEALDWTVRQLAEFLGADVAFLRRNDHSRGLSIMEAEWPVRDVVEPDLLAEVRFDADPIFAAMEHLRAPYLVGAENVEGDYSTRVEAASGVPLVDGAAVPLLFADTTWGTLGFLHFGRHAWTTGEIGALQAVASMLMQLQSRIDAEERTEFIALHDDLTGLSNRRALLVELESRLSTNRHTAVLFADLDRFKVMNDYLGHASGDQILITIADRVRTSIRPGDFAGRLGGDEFVVLVDGIASQAEILTTAYRMLDVISQPIDFGGQLISHTASIGIVLSTPGTATSSDLLGWADVALYAAKRQGRNQAVVFDNALQQLVNERSHTELNLRKAVQDGGLRIHYQPEVNLATGQLLAMEALVRWEHPTQGLLPAASFITVAEETGIVVDIGQWVFVEVCRQMAAWRRLYPNLPLIVRVNMSPAQFVDHSLVDFMRDTLDEHGIPGECVCIEVTEHAMVEESDQTDRLLHDFQAMGVEVAIDDFGTGYASMTELKRLPVNVLKLDQTFVRGITTDSRDRAIVAAIIQLGKALDLGIVAEGVESQEILDRLVEMGCYRGQGYLISLPKSAEDLVPVLSAGAIDPSTFHFHDLETPVGLTGAG